MRLSGAQGARKRGGPSGGMTIATTRVRMRAAAGAVARCTIGRWGISRSMADATRSPVAAAAQADRKGAAAAFAADEKVTPALKIELIALLAALRTAGFSGAASGGRGSRLGEGSRESGEAERLRRGGAGERPRADRSAKGVTRGEEGDEERAEGAPDWGRGPNSCFKGECAPTSVPVTTSAPENASAPWRRSRRTATSGQRSPHARALAALRSGRGWHVPAPTTCSKE